MPRALITGITGQDGGYLAEHLLSLGYDVWGMARGQNETARAAAQERLPAVQLVDGDLMELTRLTRLVEQVRPDEVYNLGAATCAPTSWSQPQATSQVTGLGTLHVLEAIRLVAAASGSRAGSAAGIRFFQASSSEMFGVASETPLNEDAALHPGSPHGAAKVYAHYITINYRESYHLFACSGILFSHESPRRRPEHVSRAITLTAARIRGGLQDEVRIGDLEERRDWGFAGDYVRAMHLMLQQPAPDDFVIGTGETHSVREFAELAFARAGLDAALFVRGSAEISSPSDAAVPRADASKARRVLGWRPTVGFAELAEMMVDADTALVGEELRRGALAQRPAARRLRQAGAAVPDGGAAPERAAKSA